MPHDRDHTDFEPDPAGTPDSDLWAEWTRTAEKQRQKLERSLGLQEGQQDRRLPDPAIGRNSYMRRLRAELRMDVRPSRDAAETEGDPFGNYLDDVAFQIEEGANRIRSQLRKERRGVEAISGDVVCCVINGLYRLILSQTNADRGDADSVRRVAEEDVRRWLLVMRSLLEATRATLQGASVEVGGSGGLLKILHIDITEILMEGVEAAASSLLFSVHELVAEGARAVDKQVTEAIHETRCAPLLRIWSSIYDAIFGGASSILARTRAYLRDVLLKKARKRRKELLGVGLGGELNADRRRRYLRRVGQLIDVIDALLSAVSVFDLCRIDTRPDQNGEDGGGREERPRDDTTGGPTGPDEPGRPPSGGSSGQDPAGGTDSSSPEQAVGGGPGRRSFTEREDPDLGRVSVLDGGSGQNEDYLYLTPTNAAKFMASELGMDPDRALAIAQSGQCQDNLSEETEEILNELGIVDEQA